MKIAALAYACERLPGWVAHETKLIRLLEKLQADLVVMPEYAALEAALVGNTPEMLALDWRDLAVERAEAWRDQMALQAQRHNCHILAGSGPWQAEHGIVNRSWLIGPNGALGYQDKMILTPYERDVLHMVPGQGLRLFDTALGRVGVLICYDSEFPLLARAMVANGADMLLVPSCTDLEAGQTRVRQSARARAIEGQCLVVQAPLVGAVAGCDIIDQSVGRAGVFCPPDHGLPSNGILAEGEANRPGAVVLEVDPIAIASPRQSGQVGNFSHWPEQDIPSQSVEIIPLGQI